MDDSWNIRLLGHIDFNGVGDCMHVNIKDGYAFVAHQGAGGVSIVDVRDPSQPRQVGGIELPPNTRGHKVQIADDVMLVNYERLSDRDGGLRNQPWAGGIGVFDVSNPLRPRMTGFWSCGGEGAHRMAFWDPPHAYVSAGASDLDYNARILIVLDLSDIEKPVEVSRWWYRGMRRGEQAQRDWPADRIVRLHHGVPWEGRLYCGWWDLGMVILDISDPTDPRLVSMLDVDQVDGPSRRTHTACPLVGRSALVVTEEEPDDNDGTIQYHARLVDISDDANPRVVSRLPVPEGDFRHRAGRFGPHNVHEPRPGSFKSGDMVFLTYFNAGLRVYDVTDLADPREVGYFVPKAPPGFRSIQINDVFVDGDGLIYTTDRNSGGLYILEMM